MLCTNSFGKDKLSIVKHVNYALRNNNGKTIKNYSCNGCRWLQ